MTKYTPILLSNRFISLTSEYGYTILLNIILAKISIHLVMFFWIVKAISALLAMKVNNRLKNVNRKRLLISLEFWKGSLIALVIFFKSSYLVLVLAFAIAIEIINIVFNASIYSTVPQIIPKDKLLKFNSLYTSVGSLSYFLAPLFVGLLINMSENLLFIIYSVLLLMGGGILFFFSTKLKNDVTEREEKENIKLLSSFKVLCKDKFILNMFVSSLIVGTLGVLFDAYEVVFIVDDLKIGQQNYSFSLSFLAIAFLGTSLFISFKKKIRHFFISYTLGLGFYLAYLLLFGNARNIYMILLSYAFLALGQTIMGIVQGNYQQTHLKSSDLSQVYTFSEMINQFLSGVSVMIAGFSPIFYEELPRSYSLLSVLISAFVIFLFIMVAMKEKINQSK